jgi:FG-GAP-like repeat
MTTYTFIAKSSTQFVNWSDPTVWAGGVVPNASDADAIFPTVTTSGGAIYASVVRINQGQSFSTRSVSLTNNDLWLTGSLLSPTNLTIAGDFALNTGGELILDHASVSAGSMETTDRQVHGSGQISVAGLLSNAAEIIGNGLIITAGSLTNSGLLGAASGDMTVNVSNGGFSNLSGSTLTGGTYLAGGSAGGYNSTLYLNVGGLIVNNAADIVLNAGAIASYDSGSSTFVPLESSLQTVSSPGTLSLGGRTFNWGNLTVGGELSLFSLPASPGETNFSLKATLNAPQLIIGASGHVSGIGTIHAPIANDGTITSNALKIDGTVTGSGHLEIADGGTLELTGAVSQTVMFLGDSGLLTLDDPDSFAGSISAAAPGDQIKLAGLSLSSVTGYHYSGDDDNGVLTIHFSSHSDVELDFSGHFSTQSFTLAAGDQPLSTSPPSLVITEQGFVAPPSDDNSIPQDINDGGDIVGYYVDQNGDRHGFLKSGGSYVEVPIIGLPFESEFNGINDSGDIAGIVPGTSAQPGFFGSSVVTGFLYQDNALSLHDFHVPASGRDETHFEGINDDGAVVGYFTNPIVINPRAVQSYTGFIFQNGSFQTIGPANNTLPYGVNDEGQVVGVFLGVTGMNGIAARLPAAGFLYDAETGSFSTFTAPSATRTFARDINDDGIIVGYYESNSGTHGFAYDTHANTWAPIDAPGAVATYINGINDLDQMVGYYVDHDGATHSFVSTVPPPFPTISGNVDEWILSNGKWEASAQPGSHPAGSRVATVADFTGDGTSDILWQNVTTGAVDLWKMSHGAWNGSVDLGTHPGSGWQIAGAGDFNGDGTNDVFWFNPASGQTDIWQLVNGQWAASTQPGAHPLGYQVAGIADFNHDGTSDVLWFNPTTRHVDEWNIVNGQWAGSNDIGTHPNAGFQIAGVGDFNNDGTGDVFWYNPGTGATDIWFLQNGHWSASVSPGNHPTGWQAAGVGDFNGDGTSDVLWYNPTTGASENWIMADGHWARTNVLGVHPGSATIAGAGDFNGGGTSDILWHQLV